MTLAAIYRALLILILCTVQTTFAKAQYNIQSQSWQSTYSSRQGAITVLWYDIEPFIYRDGKGGIIGVEYELMEGFKPFLKTKYGVDLTINWVDAKSFENIYPYISKSKEMGLFGLSFYSITDERKKEVKFSPPYMPDLNIVVTNNNLPVYTHDSDFIRDMKKMEGFTMKQTTMEEDLLKLKSNYYPSLPVQNQVDDYRVLEQISTSKNAFGYVPVSIYVVALQRGIKVKRQRVLGTRREGFAAIYTKQSDWDEPVNEYFNSSECKALVSGLIKKYLGEEVAEIILNVSTTDSLKGKPTDIELLTKEREIVTQRLIDTALEVERERTVRNIMIIAGALMVVLASVIYNRFRIKKKLSEELHQRNELINVQKKQIEEMNEQLKMKILQSRLNPHFLFNSLNSIQYFISLNDKKSALQYLNRFAVFLRNVLKYGDEISITADKEAKLLEQYLWLEQSRFPGRFEYTVQIDDDGKVQQAEVPPLLIHSLVEDAVYLGVLNLPSEEKGKLNVIFAQSENELIIKIRDSGMIREEAIKLQKKKRPDQEETAAEILEKRLDLFNKRVERKITVLYQQATEMENGFINETILTIPQPLFKQ